MGRPTSWRTGRWLLVLAAVLVSAAVLRADDRPAKANHLAIVVNPRNATTELTLKEVRATFLLERQFWKDGSRIVLYLRPTGSVEKSVLLEKVYSMSADDLKKHWTSQVFSGKLPAVPSVCRTAAAAIAAVQQSEGGISAVLSSDVTGGVRVLKIDGKLPGDGEYPLVEVKGS